MADQIITERPIKQQSGFNLNSYLLGLDADSYRILISDLAKKIVEDYSGSTLAGSAQAVKTALDSIDSTIGNTAMGTTATTITGAIAEHESDISTLNGNLNARVGPLTSINRARIASSTGNVTKAYARASAVGAAYGTALVSNNSRLWFVMFNPSGPTITNIVGTGGTITYDSSTLTFTITSPTSGQMTVWAGGGIGSTGEITFGS